MGVDYKSSCIDSKYKSGGNNNNIKDGDVFKSETVKKLKYKINYQNREEK